MGFGKDIYSIDFVLLVMLLGKPLCFSGKNFQQDQVGDLTPASYSDKLEGVAVALSTHVVCTKFKAYDEQIVNWSELTF